MEWTFPAALKARISFFWIAQYQRGDGVGVDVGVSVAVAVTSVSVGAIVAVYATLEIMGAWVETAWEVAAGAPQAVNNAVMINKEVKPVRILFPLVLSV